MTETLSKGDLISIIRDKYHGQHFIAEVLSVDNTNATMEYYIPWRFALPMKRGKISKVMVRRYFHAPSSWSRLDKLAQVVALVVVEAQGKIKTLPFELPEPWPIIQRAAQLVNEKGYTIVFKGTIARVPQIRVYKLNEDTKKRQEREDEKAQAHAKIAVMMQFAEAKRRIANLQLSAHGQGLLLDTLEKMNSADQDILFNRLFQFV